MVEDAHENHTGEADWDGLTDEAVLHYRKVRVDKKDPAAAPRLHPGPSAPDAATTAGGVGASAAAAAIPGQPRAEVSFDQRQLNAQPVRAASSGALDDPWGTDDDEYAVPDAVTRSEETRGSQRRRPRAAGMALRGAGTRGQQGNRGPAGTGAPMMAPGAGTGTGAGVAPTGAVGAVAPPPGAAVASANLAAGANSGTAGIAGASMPGSLLQGTAGAKAATSAAYAPLNGFSAPLAAGADAGAVSYDAESIRALLHASGFGAQETAAALDGTSLAASSPATERSSSATTSQGGAAGATSGGSGSGILVGPGQAGGSGSSASPGYQGQGAGSASLAGAGAGSGSASAGVPGASASGSSTSAVADAGRAGSPVVAGSSGAGGSGGGVQLTAPSASGSGGTDFSVSPSDLRREAHDWSGLHDLTGPMRQVILQSPDPMRMFGVMTEQVGAYRQAVDSAVESVEVAGENSLTTSEQLYVTASNYDEAEQAAIATTGRIGQ